MDLGYALSSEEHPPADLIRNARLAEEAGLGFGLISDHIHPWTNDQGHSGFVWSVIAGIAGVTSEFRLGTGVTCPLIPMHPAIVAHAAATSACLMPGRFFLGVGTGENLNEHVTGAKWPAADERLDMLEEAVALMRELWRGDYVTHRGKHYTVESLRIFDVPDDGVDVAVAAMQPKAAQLAGKIGDALINVAPEQEIIEKFEGAGGKGKPKYGMLTCCWAKSKDEAQKIADFEGLVEDRSPDDLEGSLTLGPDPDEYLDALKKYDKAGYTHAYIHQVGPDQEGFLRFARDDLLTRL